MTPETKQKIRQICTYHGDEGTSGYCLSDEQFEKLFDLIDEEIKDATQQERQFVLNILDGIDIADGECNTKAIRLALQSRLT